VTVYTTCPNLCYKADKSITCQFSLVWLFYIDKWRSDPYISATIGAAIASTALILSPRIPGELHPLLGTAYFALASAMACRVFRAVLLGIIKGPEARVDLANIPSVIRSTTGLQHDGDDVTTPRRDKPWSPKLKTKVEVEMNTRAASYDEYTLWDRNLKGDDHVSRLV
jgi:hypothetical protein